MAMDKSRLLERLEANAKRMKQVQEHARAQSARLNTTLSEPSQGTQTPLQRPPSPIGNPQR